MNIISKLSKREKVITYAVIAIIVLSLVYNFLIDPLFIYSNNINRKIKLANIKLQKAILIVKKKPEIDREYAIYADRLKPKANDEQEITSILNELEVIGRNSNLKITSMNPKLAQDKEYYKMFTVELGTESDMNSLMKFIYDVKNSPQLLKIERLNINTKSSQQGVVIKAAMVVSKVAIR